MQGAGAVLLAVCSSTDAGLGAGGDADIFFTISHDHGVTWNPPALLPTLFIPDGTAEDIEPSFGSKTGANMIVWASTQSSPNGTHDIFSAHGSVDGSSWVNPFPVGLLSLGADTIEDRLPTVVGSGLTFVCAWQRNDGSDTDIWFSRTTGNGGPRWSAATPLQSNAGTDDGRDAHVRLATDGTGKWVAVWTSQATLGGTIGNDSDVLFARSTDDGVTWSAPAALNTTAFSDPLAQDFRPVIAIDKASGVWITAWTSTNTLGGTIGSDEDILFARSTNGGATWSAPLALDLDAATDSNLTSDYDVSPCIEADQVGHFVCVWERTRGGSEYDIAGARSDDLGLTWGPPVLVNTNAATDVGQDQVPRIIADGTGHWTAAWNSTESLGGSNGTDGDVLSTRFMIPSSVAGVATRYCFGYRESGNPSPCPCANAAVIGSAQGCRNSTGTGAAVTFLDAPSVSAATRLITGSSVVPGAGTLFFQGLGQANFGIGTPFGDGLLSVGGTIIRLGVAFASGSGQALLTFVPIGVAPGAVRFYQGWYRDTGATCGGGLFNLTSAVAVTWTP
ncbi:MAG: sialidase family protein [Planctomycetota bacterium]|nr:sialidase family protein [Planctomycetota bacterium]